jgi:hypothetical protein
MSYILDALRRLEQDKELAKRGASPMEAVLVPDVEGVEEPERMRLRWLGGGVVLLIAAIALTYWITRNTLAPPAEHARDGAATQLSSTRPASDPPPPFSRSETASSSFQPPPLEPQRTAPAQVASSSPPVRSEERALPAYSAEGIRAPSHQETVAMVPDEAEPEIIQEWRGSEIKINAIAYSRDVRSRFAVVNLKTVHEGDRFEGLAVVEIQENGIVFEDGGTKYRVLLGKR